MADGVVVWVVAQLCSASTLEPMSDQQLIELKDLITEVQRQRSADRAAKVVEHRAAFAATCRQFFKVLTGGKD